MTRLFLKLDKIEDVKKFYEITNLISEKAYLQQDEYLIDAKSLMGIFSLNLSKLVTFICEQELGDSIYKALTAFSVDKKE
jgi:hypothetical protein